MSPGPAAVAGPAACAPWPADKCAGALTELAGVLTEPAAAPAATGLAASFPATPLPFSLGEAVANEETAAATAVAAAAAGMSAAVPEDDAASACPTGPGDTGACVAGRAQVARSAGRCRRPQVRRRRRAGCATTSAGDAATVRRAAATGPEGEATKP